MIENPDPLTLDAKNYHYGFLAASLHGVLDRPLGSPLSPQEQRQVDLAQQFLSDAIAGVRLVSRGETGAFSAVSAVGALGRALGPLDGFHTLRSEEEILGLFRTMQESLVESLRNGHLSGSPDALRDAARLFDFLHEKILVSLKGRRRAELQFGTFA